MKVLHVLSGDLWAGAEVMAYNLLKGLTSMHSCEVLAVLLNEGQVAARLRKEKVQVVVLDEGKLSFPSLLLGLHRILRDFRPRIIHAHRYKENLLAYLASRGGKISLVSTQHGLPETLGEQSTLKNRLIRGINFVLLSKCFDRLVAVSNEMKDLLAEKGMNQKKLPVIHNGIELPRDFQRPSSNDRFVVGSCGRLFPVKNYELFIETASRVTAKSPLAKFELAGGGPQLDYLRLLCSQHELDGNFSFLGHVQDMQSFYQNLDIYISTSIHEGIPMSVLEAMGHGLPVIAPRVGGFPEIIDHGVDGFLIPEHDPERFAQACLQLQCDLGLLSRMSKAARSKIESKFSTDRMTADYHNLYQQLVA